jgi:hypothetical protein
MMANWMPGVKQAINQGEQGASKESVVRIRTPGVRMKALNARKIGPARPRNRWGCSPVRLDKEIEWRLNNDLTLLVFSGGDMVPVACEKCGHPLAGDARGCAHCGHASKNGAAPDSGCAAKEVTAPRDKNGMVIYPVPQELIESARATFNEEEYVAALREVERTGGLELKDFIHELELGVLPRE